MQAYKRFGVVSICFVLLVASFTGGNVFAACSPSVQIAGHSSYAPDPTSLKPIQDAYDYASDVLGLPSFTLKLTGEIFSENLIIDKGAVEFDGGYDCDFTTKTSPSSVFGTITITATGSLVATTNTESPKVVSTDQTSFDRDGDGYTSIGSTSGSANDCNDNDFAINPGAVEICDGLDNNCDGQIDEGLTGTDADGDGYYAEGSCAAIADDCNDNDAAINPGALDIPNDGINQDCSLDGDLTFNNGNACADCHFPDDALESFHSSRSATSVTDSSCVLCHAGPVSSILSGHYGKTVRTTDKGVGAGSTINCWTCHDDGSHSGGFPLGDGQGDVWNGVPPWPSQYFCDNCHANRATRHATLTAHNNRVINSTCGNCHTSDTTVLGDPGNGSLTSAADVDALHGVAQATDCAICHNYGGIRLNKAVVLSAIRQGLNGTQISCLDCHTDKGTNHGNFNHPIEVGPNDLSYNPGQPCSDCHVVANWTEIEGIEHNVDTNGAGSCATCHSSPRQDVQNVIADAPSYGGYPIRCLACHADKELVVHGSIDHTATETSYVTRGTSFCLDCHDPGTAPNATVDITHNGTCSLCHTIIPALQTGVPAGGGDCITCHVPDASVTWQTLHITNPPSHTSLVQVAATSCNNCHDNTLVSGAADTHNGCTSCHDADTGSLLSTAFGKDFTTGGDCTTCHIDTWETMHFANNNGTTTHNSLVKVAGTTAGWTNCDGCHSDPPPLTDAGDAKVHNSCGSCHDIDGILQSTAVGKDFTTGGDCETCHGTIADSTAFASTHTTHANAHTIAVGAGDLSYDSPGQLCSACHTVSNWAEIEGIEHNVDTNGPGSCATCHNSTRQEVIDAINAGTTTNCLNCHSNKELTVHGSIDHVSSGDVTLAPDCAACHDPGGTANATVSVTHSSNCTFCHTTVPNLQAGVSPGPADCSTCHSGAWNVTHTAVTPDHSSLVNSTGTSCVSCHDNTLVSAAPETHLEDCSNCHNANGSLATTNGTNNQDFTTGGNCTTCHGTDWGGLHTTTPDHSSLVTTTGTDNCASCHADALIDASTHLSDCSNCHDGTGALISLAVDKGFTTGGNCETCHNAGWASTHFNNNNGTTTHNSLVQVATTSCADCHSDPPPLTDGADNKVHNACGSCHTANGTLQSSAVGKNFTTGGDCTTCHGTDWGGLHTTTPDHSNLVTTAGTDNCSSCHADALIDATTHLSNCSNCHNGDGSLVTTFGTNTRTFAAGGNCESCHSGTWKSLHSPAPSHITLVTTSGASAGWAICGSCHSDPPPLISAGDPKVHDDCISCHNSNGSLQGSAVGKDFTTGGNCATCHTSTFDSTHTTHANAHTVSVGGDQSNGLLCSVCHVVSTWAEIEGTEHNVATNGAGSCATCHNSPTQTVIDVIAAGAATTCLDCHTDKTAAHGSPDHSGNNLVTLTSPCADCHDPGSAANATVEITHGGNCSLCHTASIPDLQSGLQAGTCVTCHGSNVQTVHPTCSTCHGEPPSGSTAPNRDNAHSEHDLLGYGSVSPSCAACHNGAAHYDGTTQVSIPSGTGSTSFDDKDFGSPSFNGSTCSNTRCHGGQTTPSWSTGSINVNTQCISCHNSRERGSDQYNDYGQSNDEHDKHVRSEGFACTVCHSVTKLANGSGGNTHFSNLQTTTFELNPRDTIGGSGTSLPDGTYNISGSGVSCNLTCHNENHRDESWSSGGWGW